MAIKRCPASIDVVEAAKIRIRNVFRNGLPVYMSFSGGKDSLCLSQLVMNLIQAGEINPAQLIVQFIDEEAIFPCIEGKVREWRKYEWSTSFDVRVRDSHFALEGKIFSWDDPPETDNGRRCHPGEDYQCRCCAIPVFDIDTLDLPV